MAEPLPSNPEHLKHLVRLLDRYLDGVERLLNARREVTKRLQQRIERARKGFDEQFWPPARQREPIPWPEPPPMEVYPFVMATQTAIGALEEVGVLEKEAECLIATGKRDFDTLDRIVLISEQQYALGQRALEPFRELRWRILERLGESAKPQSVVPIAANPETGAASSGRNGNDQSLSVVSERAYQSFRLAEAQIGDATDREAYDWLKENGPEGYELPAFETWKRYVRQGRKHYGAQKNRPRSGRTGRSIVRAGEV